MKHLPYILIGVIIFLAAGLYIDRTSTLSSPSPLPSPLKGEGVKAPEFTGISNWLNSNALMMKDLRGKVVLIDFWTYSCINCIRTLPYVTKWDETYRDKGLVIVGVHTPEFEFEKVAENVATAIKRHNIKYPVAQDNNFATWNAYKNRYWPAKYLIDKEGKIVYTHFGEGEYEATEQAIQKLLGLNNLQMPTEKDMQKKGDVKTPEIYFGTSRLEYLSANQSPSLTAKRYSLPATLEPNAFALEGEWQFTPEMMKLTKGPGKIRMRFSSGKIFMVAEADKIITLKISVDGISQPEVAIAMSQLYTLFDSMDYKEHIIEIEIPEAGFQAFTFTFG